MRQWLAQQLERWVQRERSGDGLRAPVRSTKWVRSARPRGRRRRAHQLKNDDRQRRSRPLSSRNWSPPKLDTHALMPPEPGRGAGVSSGPGGRRVFPRAGTAPAAREYRCGRGAAGIHSSHSYSYTWTQERAQPPPLTQGYEVHEGPEHGARGAKRPVERRRVEARRERGDGVDGRGAGEARQVE